MTDPTKPRSFDLEGVSAYQFLNDIAETIDNSPKLTAFTIRFVDRFRVERLMTLELYPIGEKAEPTVQ